MSIKENCENLIKEVKAINPQVLIVAASKMQTVDAINAAKEAGIAVFAENRVQEFRDKSPNVDVTWHFIGTLQTNKVKYLVGKVLLIHSVDSDKLVDEIDRVAKNKGVVQDILIEINVGGEESKSGVAVEDFEELYKYALTKNNIKVVGLMSVMPKSAEDKYYLLIKDIYDKIKCADGNIKYLSVGMSNDYLKAIKYGANIIRIGTKIFGQRNYQEVK